MNNDSLGRSSMDKKRMTRPIKQANYSNGFSVLSSRRLPQPSLCPPMLTPERLKQHASANA
ncbi:hypothetical protein NSPZN2_30020 [Nitrospira defluvii]|uniref:Uncharacterized protein n=1 Tax=Nitrospira defluvii TaxID=330214 RepID=A0ABN7LKA0_9BACT|nr:hypothetical protein NSPZN2_30020 [Nitrospira defluvii]